jgi:hypothetical protein
VGGALLVLHTLLDKVVKIGVSELLQGLCKSEQEKDKRKKEKEKKKNQEKEGDWMIVNKHQYPSSPHQC